MFKKFNRNYRKTKQDSDNDKASNSSDEDQDSKSLFQEPIPEPKPTPSIGTINLEAYQQLSTTTVITGENKPPLKANKNDSKKSRSVLSFEDELEPDDGEEFKIKKSSHSRRLARLLKEEKKREKEEKLKTENVPTIKRDKSYYSIESPQQDKVMSEKNLKKLRNDLRILNGDEAEEMEKEYSDDDDNKFTSMIKKGIIPDATTIHFAKKQRELAKLQQDKDEDSDNSPPRINTESRLIRDEEDDSDADEQRVTMVGHRKRDEELKVIRNQFLEAEHGSDQEDEVDSDHENDWERQQINKVMNTMQQTNDQDVEMSTRNGAHTWSTDGPLAGMHAIPRTLNLDPQSISIDSLKKALQDRLTEIETVNSGHRQELERCRADLQDSLLDGERCTTGMPSLAKRFTFYQEMRGYVRDLVDCFNEKIRKIEYLEKRTLEVAHKRCQTLVNRRRQDVRDEADDIALSAKSASVQNTAQANIKETQQKQNRGAEREARRMRRRRTRESQHIEHLHHDGLSSDDEEPHSVLLKRNKELGHIGVDSKDLFEDVINEFHDIASIRDQFVRWRTEQPDSYVEAFIGLCLPRLLTPLVRYQMISWNPLADDCPSIASFPWYDALVTFGDLQTSLPPDSSDTSSPDNTDKPPISDDLKLIPSIIEKVILVKIKDFVSRAWDPVSTSETARLISCIRSLATDYPLVSRSSKHFQLLMRTVVEKIETSLQEDVFIPIYPKVQLENNLGGPYVFLQRQFWTGVKLLTSILSWHDLLSPPVLQYLAISCLVNRYLLIALATVDITADTVTRLKWLASTFPREWFASSSHSDAVTNGDKVGGPLPSCFDNFLRFVEQTATVLALGQDKQPIRLLSRVLETMHAERQLKILQKMLL